MYEQEVLKMFRYLGVISEDGKGRAVVENMIIQGRKVGVALKALMYGKKLSVRGARSSFRSSTLTAITHLNTFLHASACLTHILPHSIFSCSLQLPCVSLTTHFTHIQSFKSFYPHPFSSHVILHFVLNSNILLLYLQFSDDICIIY